VFLERRTVRALVILVGLLSARAGGAADTRATGWLSWRGPAQDGYSEDIGLPNFWKSAQPRQPPALWTYDLPGRGTPVIADGRLYTLGYTGDASHQREAIAAFDAETGKRLWQHEENDFLSDTIYSRYGIGSPAVDEETGNVYAITSAGLLTGFTRDGQVLWQHSMMEEFGKLTFPNGRTGSPVIVDDLVIIHGITANWGGQAPPRDRAYAFDKLTGAHVWASTPGGAPKDNSFSLPVVDWWGAKRVLYYGEGSGSVVAVNARTGDPLWRYQIGAGGVNASAIVDDEGRLFAIHGVENIDSSASGRMVAIDLRKAFAKAPTKPGEPVVLDRSVELWRADLSGFSSSPVLGDGTLYLTDDTGNLVAVEPGSGKILWKVKLERDQIHASPVYADGKLYIPMNNGRLHIVKPTKSGPRELSVIQLAGNSLGAPAVWHGKVYVQTTEKLYAFGKPGPGKSAAPLFLGLSGGIIVGPATQLQLRPSELLLRPGDRVSLKASSLDGNGDWVADLPSVACEKWIPPTAKVKSYMDADFDASGVLVVGPNAKPTAGAFLCKANGLTGVIRGRVVSALPLSEDFESYPLTEPHPTEKDVKFAYPPLSWIGSRGAWEVRQRGDSKVLAKTLDAVTRQRSQTFIGHPDMHDYTIAADVLSDGNKRLMSDIGVIDQRYIVALKGTQQLLEVTSNFERVRVSVPFAWKPGVWYRLKARVDANADGSTVVRAKAWQREAPEPDAWTIEVPHPQGHLHGSPGFFGFAPTSLFRVYIDNISVTPNEASKP
jgi:outer membrane protein assembly factor BamB